MSVDKFEEELNNLGMTCRFIQLTNNSYIVEDSLGNIVYTIIGKIVFSKRLPDTYIGDSLEGQLEYVRRLNED